MNNEIFIKKSKLIHGDKFDYSKFEYKNSKTKSILICNLCKVEILTTPSNNLLGNGCKKCYDNSKIDKDKILKNLLNKNKNWSFDLENYKNSDSNISYICNNGHIGSSSYRNMIRSNVCKDCNELNILDKKKKDIENNNITILEYNSDKDIKVRCNQCNHISENNYRALTYTKYKCNYCIISNKSELIKNKIVKLLEINGSKIKLKCNNDHIYEQDRRNLLSGKRCVKCYLGNKVVKKEDLINLFKDIHGDYFTYNIDSFQNLSSNIDIICRNGHKFKQKASNHLQGKGCSICRESSGERVIVTFLEKRNINYIRQKKFKDCLYRSQLPFDFYLPDFNTLIEFDGIQHFKPVSVFGGEKEFEKTKIRDKIKNEYCLKNNIHLIRISYLENIEEKLSTIEKLITF